MIGLNIHGTLYKQNIIPQVNLDTCMCFFLTCKVINKLFKTIKLAIKNTKCYEKVSKHPCIQPSYLFSVYKYRKEGLTECSTKCGNAGTITDKLVCIEDGVRTVDDWYCKGVAKPQVETRPCNRQDCPPQLVFFFNLIETTYKQKHYK